jgi:capsular exopolysaccharide synthesis family protein
MQLDKNAYFLEQKRKQAEKANSGARGLMKSITGTFPERGRPSNASLPDQKPAVELDPAITGIVLDNLKPEILPKGNVIRLNFTAADPGVAAAVANGAANALIAYNLKLRLKPYQEAVDWLEARLPQSKAQVEASEKVLQKYREKKGVASFEAKEGVINQQLQELITQYVQAEGRRQEAEVKYQQILSMIDNPERLATIPEIMKNQVIQALRTEELNLKMQLSELSEKFGAKHPQIIKTNSQIAMVQQNLIAEARKMLSSAKTELDFAIKREQSLRQSVEAQKAEVLGVSRDAIDYNVISDETKSNKQFYSLLLKKLQEASLSSGTNVSDLQVIDYATPSGAPVKPKRSRVLLLAALLGLAGGLGAAFFAEHMDDTIKSAADVELKLKLPFLCTVPLVKDEVGPLLVLNNPKSAAAESIRTIRTSVVLSADEKPLKVLLVTSSVPNEGKTTIAANLAVALAQAGENVIMIDADLRRPNLHERFGLENKSGITDVLRHPETLQASFQKVAGVPNLAVLTGGTVVNNPSETIGAALMKSLIAAMSKKCDRLIIDAPPIRAFSDPLMLSRLADGVLLIVSSGQTPRVPVQQSVQALLGVQAHILGVVLNKADVTRHHDYYYSDYSSYYYGAKGKKGRKKKKPETAA